jgi:CDP-4-dehydro-6-deoxyglucose reductase
MNSRVKVIPSGHEFEVGSGESILDGALRQGYSLPYGCRNGACGTCKGKIVSGKVDLGHYEAHALSDDERQRGLALFCQAVPKGDLVIESREITNAGDIQIQTLPCRVARMERLAHDVMALYLKLPENQRMQFLAGQYIDVLLRDGQRRSFSLANAPSHDEFLQLHIRQVEGGKFTSHVFAGMREKDLLRIRGPLGTFYLREDSERPIIFMAGGTGFAPIKGIVEHIMDTGLERPMHLFWGVRARRDLYMDELARNWQDQLEHFRYTPVLSSPLPEDHWQGNTGWVHEAVVAEYPDLSGYQVYASGPPPMIEAGKQLFMAHGLEAGHMFSDSFEFTHDE